jgi:hypothetical protein
LIKKFKILVECDGEQHFSQVSNWAHPEQTQERDVYKMEQAILHGYKIIRISAADIRRDDDWQDSILNLDLDDKVYDYVTSVSEHSEVYEVYCNHMELLKESIV